MRERGGIGLCVRKFILAEGLIKRGDLVLLGLSGGADSVCLLSLLHSLSHTLGFSLHAVHVHHGIRGKEADRDLCFCRMLCAELSIPFTARFVDSPGYARAQGMGLEEAARALRYRVFGELREVLSNACAGDCLVAVAHHMEDQAETFFHHLFRGSGLKGLSGMEARRGYVIRPLLPVRREGILRELRARGLPYVLDSTNLDTRYTRNRIRAQLIPAAEAVNAEAVGHIARTCTLLGETEALLRELSRAFLCAHAEGLPEDMPAFSPSIGEDVMEGAGQGIEEIRMPLPPLRALRPILRRYVLMEMLGFLSVPRRDWCYVHLAAMDGLLSKGNGAHLDLPYKVSADIVGRTLIVKVQEEVLSLKGKARKKGRKSYE